jgi:hypothetical protein
LELEDIGVYNNSLIFTQIKVDESVIISNVSIAWKSNSATFDAGQNWIGLYQNNVLVGQTADLTSLWQGAPAEAIQTVPLIAPVTLAAGYVAVGAIINYSAGQANFYGRVLNTVYPLSPWNMAPNFRIGSFSATTLPANLNGAFSDYSEVWFVLS